jgi:hypothetical protein
MQGFPPPTLLVQFIPCIWPWSHVIRRDQVEVLWVNWLLHSTCMCTRKINNASFPEAVRKCRRQEYKYWYKNVRYFEEYRSSKCAVYNAFAQLRKAPISFVISSGPSCITADYNWTVFHEIWYCGLLWNFVEELQIWSKSNKKLFYSLQEDPSMFCCCRRQIRHRRILVQRWYSVDSDMCLNKVHRMHCYVCTVTKVTRTRHNTKLYVNCISFLLTSLYLFCLIIIGPHEVKRHKSVVIKLANPVALHDIFRNIFQEVGQNLNSLRI